MPKVILRFPTLENLLDFTITANLFNCYIDKKENQLVAALSEADIELAQKAYAARLIRDEQLTN